jgi:hypothetical protein
MCRWPAAGTSAAENDVSAKELCRNQEADLTEQKPRREISGRNAGRFRDES